MTRTIRRILMAGLVLAPLAATPAFAQWPVGAPTQAGTPITNQASASFKDANENTYTAASNLVTITVSFQAAIDVTDGTTTAVAGTTSNTAQFTLTNQGNDYDSFEVDPATVSDGAKLTVRGYRLGSDPTDLTLAELNTALAGNSYAWSEGVDVWVVYDLAAGTYGGGDVSITLSAKNTKDGSATDAGTVTITPQPARSVKVETNNGSVAGTDLVLPNTATKPTYTVSFSITNTGDDDDTFTLDLTSDAVGATIVSPNVVGGKLTVASGATEVVTVEYATAPSAPRSTVYAISLQATSDSDTNQSVSNAYAITVKTAGLSLVKAAQDAQGGAALTEIAPGISFWYEITVENDNHAHGADAEGVVVTDNLPAQLEYVSLVAPAGWTGSAAGNVVTFTKDGTGTIAKSDPAVKLYIEVKVK